MNTARPTRYPLALPCPARHRIPLIIVCVAAIFSHACNNSDDEPAPALPVVCRLTTQTTNGSIGTTATFKRSSINTYDEKGNKISLSIDHNYDYTNGDKEIITGSTAYTYDDAGFLLRRVNQETKSDKDGLVSTSSYDIAFEYQNERLSKENFTGAYNGATTSYSLLYEYDSEGRIIKYSNTKSNAYNKYEYAGDRILRITYVDAVGNSRSPFIEYNSKGQLVKSIDTQNANTTEWRYEYNTEGDLIRNERHVNGKPYEAVTFEFDNKVNPYKVTSAPFRGHPEFPDIQAYPDYNHNVTKTTYYSGNAAGQWEQGSTSVNTYTYNSNDVPTENISKTFDKLGAQYSSELSTLQYQGCN